MTEFNRIVALGAGRMGRGLGHMFAYAGREVTVLDIKERDEEGFKQLEQDALAEIRTNMEFLVSLEVMTAAQVEKALALIEIKSLADAEKVLGNADIVIEGVPETSEAKNRAMALLNQHMRSDAVITSTTSTMAVAELQQQLDSPARFLNTHFLNPAYLIPLVEVSPGPDSNEQVVEKVMNLFESIGKQPVRCAASPGYIIPRLQSLLMAEACRMIEEGVVSAEELDKAIKYGFGPRYASMGIVEFIDWGGLDITYYAGHYLSKALDSPAFVPPASVDRMMAEGKTGLRAGQGYYDFSSIDAAAWQKERLSRFVTLLGQLDQIPRSGV